MIGFKSFWGTFTDDRVIGFKCFRGTFPDDRVYFPRQSIHTLALVFQIGGGANFSPLYVIGGSASIQIALGSKRCQSGIYSVKGVSTQSKGYLLRFSHLF